MRVRSHLREIRGTRSISDVTALTGIARGEISMLERGHLLPRDGQVAQLERAYGDPSGWYPAGVWRAAVADIRACPGCGEELPPGAHAGRRYHGPGCRRAARARR